jgi:hypothetical protein
MQERERPDINIICEKVAFQGLTRFEDRHALPLGVSTNHTAYSAKLLTQARAHTLQTKKRKKGKSRRLLRQAARAGVRYPLRRLLFILDPARNGICYLHLPCRPDSGSPGEPGHSSLAHAWPGAWVGNKPAPICGLCIF